jgi:hypothetical protein
MQSTVGPYNCTDFVHGISSLNVYTFIRPIFIGPSGRNHTCGPAIGQLSSSIHELAIGARQLASVAQLVRALHRNRKYMYIT